MFGDLLEPVALRPWVLYTYGIHRNPGAEHERQGRISRESRSLLQPCRVTMQYHTLYNLTMRFALQGW